MRSFHAIVGMIGVIFGVAILAMSSKAHGLAVLMIATGSISLIGSSLMRRRP
jgi:hypothetical protein